MDLQNVKVQITIFGANEVEKQLTRLNLLLAEANELIGSIQKNTLSIDVKT